MLDLHLTDMKTPNLTKNTSKTGKTDLKYWILEAQVYINQQENRATIKAFILSFLGAILVTFFLYKKTILKTAITDYGIHKK